MLESSRKNLRSSSSGSVLRSGDQQVYAQKKSQVHKHSSRNAATHHLNLQQSSLNVAVRYHVSRAYSFAKQLHFRKNVPPPSLEKNIAQKPTRNVSFFCLLRVVFTSFFTLRSLQRLHIPTKFNPNLPPVALMATSSHPKFVVVVYFF